MFINPFFNASVSICIFCMKLLISGTRCVKSIAQSFRLSKYVGILIIKFLIISTNCGIINNIIIVTTATIVIIDNAIETTLFPFLLSLFCLFSFSRFVLFITLLLALVIMLLL